MSHNHDNCTVLLFFSVWFLHFIAPQPFNYYYCMYFCLQNMLSQNTHTHFHRVRVPICCLSFFRLGFLSFLLLIITMERYILEFVAHHKIQALTKQIHRLMRERNQLRQQKECTAFDYANLHTNTARLCPCCSFLSVSFHFSEVVAFQCSVCLSCVLKFMCIDKISRCGVHPLSL